MHLPPDPSWCARINAHRAPAADAPPPAPAPPPPLAPAARREVDRVDFDPHHDPAGPIWCELCGSRMHYTAACKIRCGNCGYTRDCSDP